MRICVVGLGKIGLPLAVQYAGKGHQVVGVDVQQTVVEQVNAATEPFPGETDLAARLAAAVSAGRLRATSSHAEGVAGADAVVMVVPIYVDEQTGQPDYGWMDAATRAVAAALRPGVLVAYETTLPVGTTRGRWKPMIEEASGLVDGQDLDVVFSPERVLTGIADACGVSGTWVPPRASAQTLSDRVARFGTTLVHGGEDGEKTWVSVPLAHRPAEARNDGGAG